jgi:7,8-dihydropterin-6-yl-methyl-4-(beta-D-ribofuranosyl)aminobenzene 5'-phosphate synthase
MGETWRFKTYLTALLKYHRHKEGLSREKERWRLHRPTPIPDPGETGFLSILPLVDWHSVGLDFKTEMGVSYLIKTDRFTVLFDVGQNVKAEDPSPLLHNMAKLGVNLAEVDAVVISHRHYDHTGGHAWARKKSFSLGNQQIDLSRKKIVVPFPLSYPNVNPVVAIDAIRLAPGVATTGVIGRQLFTGWVDEQALAINVKNKGIVLIVGCGHQTLPRLIQRAKDVFGKPIYGVFGGLHYPVPKGRVNWFGINTQKRFASGSGIFSPLKWKEMESDLELLRKENVQTVGLSGHDSSDAVIQHFKNHFGGSYKDILVGRQIDV